MRLSTSVSLTAMALLTYSKVEAFEVKAINIVCHRGETYTATHECISATRTTDADFGYGGHIVCLCPNDHTKLREFRCDSYTASSTGIVYPKWYAGDCYSCSEGKYNNGGSCSNCPMISYGVTSEEGAVSANQCYFPKEVEQSDGTGTFVFENNCYYDGATSSPIEDSSKGATWYETESTTTTTE